MAFIASLFGHYFSSPRFVISLVIAVIAALLAAQIDSFWGRVIAIILSCIIVMVTMLDKGVAARRNHPDGFDRDLMKPINEHPGFVKIINAIDYPFIIISDSRIISANLPAIQLLGAPLIGQNIAGAFRHSSVIEHLSLNRQKIYDENDKKSNQIIAISGLGRKNQRWEMSITPIDNGYRLVQLFDKSDNHAAEKMRVDFVANASHELLTPLASVKGFIETLSDETTGSNAATRKRFLKIIADEAQRMESLIRDLMSLSRIESGALANSAQDIKFAEIAQQAIQSLIKSSDERGKDIEIICEDDIPRVSGDEGLLRQMVINIVANSMKYAQKDTPILVNIGKTQSSSMIRFSVKDFGNGIDAKHLPRLTERFYRVDSGRSKALGGTGLGLSLVKHIVQRHRGHLDIDSKLGDGTLITILLPIAAVDHVNINHVTRRTRTIGNDINDDD